MNSMIRKMFTCIQKTVHALADLCFPPRCLNCGKAINESSFLFCEGCRDKITLISHPYCPCCGIPFPAGENHLCGVCLKKKWYFDKARSIITYNKTAAKAIMGLKFGGRKAGLQTFSKLKEQSSPCEDLVIPDCIIAVPLHENRLKNRGYNQSLLLAGVFYPGKRHIIKKTIIQRSRDTIPQTGLDGISRRKNMKNAFVVKNNRDVFGKKIILVDDVFTTGTTINECARVLKLAGADRVDVLTLARVIKNW